MISGRRTLFCALGGSGEIGMNVNLYGCRGQWLMVDLGLTFAGPDLPGIDLILPDLEFIENQQDRLAGIVLTHGHEDHIGALPYLAEELKSPLYATPFTAGLIAGKLEEEGLTGLVKLNIVERGGSIGLGPFKITFVALSHSIPEGNGLLIETPFGNVFHTGDWKIDASPVIGEVASAETLTRDRRPRGSRAGLQFDQHLPGSTVGVGRERPCRTAGDGKGGDWTRCGHDLRLERGEAPDPWPGRHGKRAANCVSPAAPSTASFAWRRRPVILRDFPPTISFDEAMRLPKNEVLIIATGGQGEPRAALGRIAAGNHDLKLGERRHGDFLVAGDSGQ